MYNLYNKQIKQVLKLEKDNIIIYNRSLNILPEFVGLTFNVYTGFSFKSIEITPEMVNSKIGEFVFTKFVGKKKKKK